MLGLTKKVVKGKLVFIYKGKRITPSKYYKLRFELSKR